MAGLMEVLSDFSTLVGVGTTLEDIFGGGTPTLQDIESELTQEVATVFFGAQLQAEVISAAATLQTVRDFFAIDYLNEKKSNVAAADLWAFLNSPATPALSDIQQVAETVDGWLSATDDQPAPRDMISTAASIYLGVYLHLCLLHRERASVAPSSGQQSADTEDMREYARKALRNIQSRVMNRIANRIACLSYVEGVVQESAGNQLDRAEITDSWFGDSNSLRSTILVGESGWDPSTVLHRVWHAYRRLLWSGADADYNELVAALDDRGMGGAGNNYYDRDRFIANSLPGVRAFGHWAASARSVMGSLDVIATGFPGTAQDDWHLCAKCGGLYYGTGFPDDGTKRCPAGGQHTSSNSGDYVLHSLSPSATAPAGSQPGWSWCSKCYVLFFNGNRSVCPTGGAHDPNSSGNYCLSGAMFPRTPSQAGTTAANAERCILTQMVSAFVRRGPSPTRWPGAEITG
ncbi:MAG TPA: hypothetical protein VNA69_21125 [Thermoanaerobaculia bacterium]|nr:hypothetical protein [Thermoanaerobaculia bacterium]